MRKQRRRSKVGYKSPMHQGYKAFFFFKLTNPLAKKFDVPQPYPLGSTAYKEYNEGIMNAAEGKTWDGQSASQAPGESDGLYRGISL